MELKLDGFSHKLPLLTVTVVQSLADFKVSLVVAKVAYVMGANMLALLAGPGLCPQICHAWQLLWTDYPVLYRWMRTTLAG